MHVQSAYRKRTAKMHVQMHVQHERRECVSRVYVKTNVEGAHRRGDECTKAESLGAGASSRDDDENTMGTYRGSPQGKGIMNW